MAVALASGASIPRALETLGTATSTAGGHQLAAVGRSLLLGARWDEAWEHVTPTLQPLENALRDSWHNGAPAAQALTTVRQHLHNEALAHNKAAAHKLAVHLVLPLGLCFLPAFVLLGVIPTIATLGQKLFG